MGTVRRYLPGTPSWVDLATSDAADAKRFYGALFGWQAVEQPGGGMGYCLMKKDGLDAAGLFEMSGEMQAAGMPATWNTYIGVADLESATARATELGATILMGPYDAGEAGRMVTLRDPEGAVFNLWQAKAQAGCRVVNEPGALTWNELAVRDVARARAFYEGLFGWQGGTDARGYVSYLNRVGEEQVYAAGILPMDIVDFPPETPAHWIPYFGVADVAAARAQVSALGGSALTEVMTTPSGGRFCVAADPQGAAFYLFEMDGSDTGDSSDKLS